MEQITRKRVLEVTGEADPYRFAPFLGFTDSMEGLDYAPKANVLGKGQHDSVFL